MRAQFQHEDQISVLDFLYKDNTAVRPSYLHISYLFAGKTASLYWAKPVPPPPLQMTVR